MVGPPDQFRLRLLAFGDVFDGEYPAAGAHRPEEHGDAQGAAVLGHQDRVRVPPVPSLLECGAQLVDHRIVGIGRRQDGAQGLAEHRVVVEAQGGLRDGIEVEDPAIRLEHDEACGGGVEDGLETVALHGSLVLGRGLQSVVEVLHLAAGQQEGPVVQVALLVGVLVRRRHPPEQIGDPRVGELILGDAGAGHLPLQGPVVVVVHRVTRSLMVVRVMVWFCNAQGPWAGENSP